MYSSSGVHSVPILIRGGMSHGKTPHRFTDNVDFGLGDAVDRGPHKLVGGADLILALRVTEAIGVPVVGGLQEGGSP